VVSIVHEDRLWGLVTAQHSQPRNLSQALRVAVELLAEAMSTRIAALESNTRSEQATQVRRFEQQLLEATASVGDWRHALAHDASVLLQPLKASGAVLAHEGEVLRCGEVPAGPDLQELLRWLASQPGPGPWHWACLGGHAPTLAGLTPRVAGVLAMRLSARRSDQLIWLRRQPSHLPPGHAQPWSRGDVALASALGRVLVDINAQANAVRLLIAQSQLARVRACLAEAPQAVVVADAAAGTFFANNAFLALAGRRRHECPDAAAFAMLFTDPSLAHQMLGHVRAEQRSWHGELALRRPDGCVLPVGVRAEPVPATDGALLGCMFIFEDLRPALNAETARQQLETSLARTGQLPQTQEGRQLVDALVSNTSLAATDIADSSVLALAAHSGPMLQALQAGAERTTALLARLRLFGN
jgi:PAS domain S-box-containing protein